MSDHPSKQIQIRLFRGNELQFEFLIILKALEILYNSFNWLITNACWWSRNLNFFGAPLKGAEYGFTRLQMFRSHPRLDIVSLWPPVLPVLKVRNSADTDVLQNSSWLQPGRNQMPAATPYTYLSMPQPGLVSFLVELWSHLSP